MPVQIATTSPAAPLMSAPESARFNRPTELRQADSGWRESQRQQRRAEFWQSLMCNDRG